ncbi:MAG TPA: hypothetical protein VJM76_00670 [Gammaproteobacteria bacterium]|nr:hypothetical protein [Gammaproteobacteria bacterium]
MDGLLRYRLLQDRKGLLWDLLLYVPTVVVLGMLGLKLWYGTNPQWAYVLFFMASFFFIAGANRILKTRLMLLPAAPVTLEPSKDRVRLELRNGEKIDLVKGVRYYPDSQGKSFGLSGMDVLGRRLQFVFHRGQFADDAAYQEVSNVLKVYQ